MFNLNDGNAKGIIGALVFVGVAVSGSLVFLGVNISGNYTTDKSLEDKISKGIESYIESEQQKAADAQAEANKPKFIEGDYSDDDPVLGDKNAPVTIVEFSDYECPYCGMFYNGALVDIKKQYIDTGKAKLVYRDFPLSFHKHAYPSALFAECVGNLGDDADYYKVHDELFRTVQNGSFEYDKMSEFAVGLGIDKSSLKKCFDSDQYKDEINADQAAGQKAGINGTPGFIVNGWVVSGAQPFGEFQKIIEQELAKKK